MKFTEIPDKLPYPAKFRATLSTLHSDIITYVCDHYEDTSSYRKQVVALLNSVSFAVIKGDTLSLDYDNLFDSIIPDFYAQDLENLYLSVRDIEWDIEVPEVPVIPTPTVQKASAVEIITSTPTPKEDLYLKCPVIPQFDITKPWLRITMEGTEYIINHTLPLIPQTQNQVSMTTDLNKMTPGDLIKLFPNTCIKTRKPILYEPYGDLKCIDDIGVIYPILDFTEEQLIQNVIQYPHLYQLQRKIGDDFVSFYSSIEINGELHETMEVWDDLPDSKHIPKNAEYIKDYIIRRYLLERDVLHIEHKYPLFGTLMPYMTLFLPSNRYQEYTDMNPVDIARACVQARVSFYQSRNPVLLQLAVSNSGGPVLNNACMQCLFSAYCIKNICNLACPSLVESSYLLERNGIGNNSYVYNVDNKTIQTALSLLHNTDKMLKCVVAEDTIKLSNIIVYCAVCENWRGNRLHCSVYHLHYSNYIDDLQRSWNYKEIPDALEYQQIWTSTAKVLVISNLDYIKFTDFPAQTLLNLIHTRASNGLSTIVVSPKINTLVGNGAFFDRLKVMLNEGMVTML